MTKEARKEANEILRLQESLTGYRIELIEDEDDGEIRVALSKPPKWLKSK